MGGNCQRGKCIGDELVALSVVVREIKGEVDKMVGARPLMTKLLVILVIAAMASSGTSVYLALAANGVDNDQSVGIAINAKAIEQIAEDNKRREALSLAAAERNRLEHEQFRKDRDAQTERILKAIEGVAK